MTFWVDWISAQQYTICLRWLIQEVNLRSEGKIAVDLGTLTGTVLGKRGQVALKPDEVRLTAQHGQINWMGYRTEDARVLAVLNHDAATLASINFSSALSTKPNVLIGSGHGSWHQENKSSASSLEIALPPQGCALVVLPFHSAHL